MVEGGGHQVRKSANQFQNSYHAQENREKDEHNKWEEDFHQVIPVFKNGTKKKNTHKKTVSKIGNSTEGFDRKLDTTGRLD